MTQPTPRHSFPSVSLIVPVHKAGTYFETCLQQIASSIIAPEELIVVADGEPQSTEHLARQYNARVISIPGPSGPARARNIGAQAARSDVLLFIDADVAIAGNTVAHVKRVFTEHPEYDAIIGSYDDEPEAPNFLSQYKNLTHYLVHQHSRENASTFWGACGAVKRDVMLQLGGFDESYARPCIEDIELGYRLMAAGKKIHLEKSLQVKHLKKWTVPSLLRSDIRDRAIPWSELILSRKFMLNDLNTSRRNRTSVALIGMALTLLGLTAWKAWMLIPATACTLALLGLHWRFYTFFLKKRGGWFTVRAMVWHWFSLVYSGASFSWCLARHLLRRMAVAPDRHVVSQSRSE